MVNNKLPADSKLLGVAEYDNGFYAAVIRRENKIIIAFRGSDKFNDWIGSNKNMALLTKLPNQAQSALSLYDQIKSMYPDNEIILVGHSLGGSLAQIVAAIRNAIAVTFNAYGTGNILEKAMNVVRIFSDKITNYCNPNDIITSINAKNHIGKCYKVETVPVNGKGPHNLECMGPLEDRVPTTPEELDLFNLKKYKQKKESEYYNETGKRYPIIMPSDGFYGEKCSGSYPVSGYTRSDGTEVSGYIRNCYKHRGL